MGTGTSVSVKINIEKEKINGGFKNSEKNCRIY